MIHHSTIIIIINFLLLIFCEISLAGYAEREFHLIDLIVNLNLNLTFIHLRYVFSMFKQLREHLENFMML
jgi:hypothetical protein